MKYWIDLNADLGEGAGFDAQLLPLITSANIACGFHAGNPHLMQKSVALCVANGVSVGAHPSFPDLWGFGRRPMQCTQAEIIDYMLYQIGSLAAFCKANGVKLRHVKPHGAIYNMAGKDEKLAQAIVQGIKKYDASLMLFAQPGSCMARVGQTEGLKVIYEVFADRAYNEDGSLVSRKLPGAVLHDPDVVATRTIGMVTHGEVKTINGHLLALNAQSICLHGDNPAAIQLASAVRQGLERAGVCVQAPQTL